MTRIMFYLFAVVLIGLPSANDATAQNFNTVLDAIGRDGRSQSAAAQVEWEKISPGEILCVDNRLRRVRRSVNRLIDRGIGPADSRVARIVAECGANAGVQTDLATPSFNCSVATYPDEKTICGNPELARLDRAVVEGYEGVLAREGARAAKGISDPLLRQRHACGLDVECIKQVQLTAIAAFQARGAVVQMPASEQVTAPRNAGYAVNGIQLGSNVVTSRNYREFACAPSTQYPGFTACTRQMTERSRRRRISETTSLLHAGDGTTVYVDQNLQPVAMDDVDANNEVARLSDTLGKATLLPMSDVQGRQKGLIASWGAVSLLPLEPRRREALAAGTDDQPGLLIDQIGNLQRSAQSGLPVYRLGGGAGYVLAASWDGRGRGTLHVLTIDASRLPAAAPSVANPVVDPANVAPVPAATGDRASVAQSATVPDAAKPVDTAKAAKQAEAAPVAAPPQPQAPSPVRVVGPSIEMRPPPATAVAATANSKNGNGLVIVLTSLIVVLLGAVTYLYKKSRTAPPVVNAAVPDTAVSAPLPATAPASATTPDNMSLPKTDRINLGALIPSESPISPAADIHKIVAPEDSKVPTPRPDAA